MTPMRANILVRRPRRDHGSGLHGRKLIPAFMLGLRAKFTRSLKVTFAFGLERIPDFRLMVLALRKEQRGKLQWRQAVFRASAADAFLKSGDTTNDPKLAAALVREMMTFYPKLHEIWIAGPKVYRHGCRAGSGLDHRRGKAASVAASSFRNGTPSKKRPQACPLVTVTVSGGPDTTSEPCQPHKIRSQPIETFSLDAHDVFSGWGFEGPANTQRRKIISAWRRWRLGG